MRASFWLKVPLLFALYLSVMPLEAQTIASPDGKIELSFSLTDRDGMEDCPTYSVSWKGKEVITGSGMGFTLKDRGSLLQRFEIIDTVQGSHDTTWIPVYGERDEVQDHYNELLVRMVHTGDPIFTLDLRFRCYDEGAAFRYEFPGKAARSEVRISEEVTQFRFDGDHPAWCALTAQGEYELRKISKIESAVERPLVLELGDSGYAAIAEAGLVDYARMKLSRMKDDSQALVSRLGGEVISGLPMKTPWRVLMFAESPGRLLKNNDLILNLNDPCAIEDTSWIKPGKVIREVTLTTRGGKACVDFAVERNIQYVEFDAGWYGPEYSDESDARTVSVDPERSPGPLDLHEVIDYAERKGIGILLYVNRLALERQLEEILPLYRSWGVKGVKYGFVQVGTQDRTSWLHRAVRIAAENRLMIDIHDEYRPTGYSRTYPNLMTQEGIMGDEASPDNSQTLTTLFTRMIAGAADNTICYFSPRVEKNATHAYQLAKAVCFYSPLQFLYWYDRPSGSPGAKGGAGGARGVIGDEPELEFFDAIPTVWDDTRVLSGEIGSHAVIARRSGEEWFLGCMNSGEAREIEISLDFLDEGTKYKARIYSDDQSVQTRTKVGIREMEVGSGTVMQVVMGINGGEAAWIVPDR